MGREGLRRWCDGEGRRALGSKWGTRYGGSMVGSTKVI